MFLISLSVLVVLAVLVVQLCMVLSTSSLACKREVEVEEEDASLIVSTACVSLTIRQTAAKPIHKKGDERATES